MKNLYNTVILLFIAQISFAQLGGGGNYPTCEAEGFPPGSTRWFRDTDNDQLGDPNHTTCSINQPTIGNYNWVQNDGDCDDTDASLPSNNFWADSDGDGYGDPNNKYPFQTCDPGSGWVSNNDDCDDSTNTVYPGAPEICDGLDNDCDNQTDEGLVTQPSGVTVTTTGCGEVTLSHNGPSSWYWQTSASGTSQSDNANPKVVTTGSTLWLRAKSGICWSSALEVTFSTDPITVNQPGVAGTTERCGNGDLTLTPGYVTHQGRTASHFIWYNASGNQIAQTTAGSSETFTLNQASTYYEVAAVVEECEGPTIGVTLTVNYPPQEPTAQEIRGCGTTTVQLVNPPTSGPIKWYWQTSSNSEDIGDNVAQKTFNGSGTAFIRAYNENTTCWSTAETINYAVNQPPATPDATVDVTQNCGSVTLSYTDTSGSGVDWYWQSDQYGIQTEAANAATSIDLSSGTEYFLRALSSNGCWSNNSLQINYNITSSSISPPTVSDTDRCDVGDIVLYPEYNGLHDPNDNNITFNFYKDGTLFSNVPYGGTFSDTISETTTYEVRSVNDGCEGPGTNVTATVIVPDMIFYADFDGDGLGDPFTPSELVCEQPVNYVADNTDNCPGINDPTNACVGVDVNATHNPDNYVYSRTYQVARSTQLSSFFTASDDVIQEIGYFDGLGRARQQIAIDQTPGKNDLVTHVGFDGFNRQAREWLPYEATAGALASYRSSAEDDTDTWYEQEYGDEMSAAAPNPFSQQLFEASPLNRVLKQGAPGEAWLVNPTGPDNTIEMEYQTNTATEVLRFSVTTDNSSNANTFVPSLQANGTYAVGELTKVITKDENHDSGTDHTMEEFKDKNGRVVLKRTYNAGEAHDTYYVYDDFGNLSFVLPPLVDAVGGVSTTEMEALCYQYVYDDRNRLVEKQLPGKGREYIVYNDLDQPIMTQDANQKAIDEWLFTKYDAFGRVAYTGKVTDDRERTAVQSSANGVTGNLWVDRGSYSNGGIDIGYDNTAYPTTGITEVLTVNYYDDYNFNRANEPTPPTQVFGEDLDDRVKGLATGTKVRVLDTDDWITAVTRYNYQGNAIYTYSENEFLTTVDIVTTDIDYVGRPLTVRSAHTRGLTNVVTLDNFTYDHIGRLLTQTQCIGTNTLLETCPTQGGSGNTVPDDLLIENETVTDERTATNSITVQETTTLSDGSALIIDPNANNGALGGQELIVSNTYDELGQLISKNVGGDATGNGLQTVDYTYNIRGWVLAINDANPNDNALTLNSNDLWGFRIKYNDITDPTKQLFNGNISETLWGSKTTNPTGNPVSNRYTYSYDAMNRLTGAVDNTANYDVSSIVYDKMGNIQTLTRDGFQNSSVFANMDVLDYDYDNGNKLLKVRDDGNDNYGFIDRVDQTVEFTYDQNGNLLTDVNKGVTGIQWNYLNMPTNITVSNPQHNGSISYVYSADGIKLQKTAINISGGSNIVTDYAGAYQYVDNNLEFIRNFEDGYIYPKNNAGYGYMYYYTDQLDNIRLMYSDDNGDGSIDPAMEIVKEQHFYPFGLKLEGFNGFTQAVGSDFHKYDYQDQERQDELGLNWIQFKYRMLDPALGRFVSIDPLASDYTHNSTFAFAENKVIMFNELEGLEVTLNKFQRLSYDNPQQYAGTFIINAGISVANAAIDAFNYAGDLDRVDQQAGGFGKGAAQKVAQDASAIKEAAVGYAQNTTLEEFGADLKNIATDIKTYEDLAGGFATGSSFTKLGKLGSINKISNPVPSRLAKVRSVDYSGSPTLGAPNASDVFVTAASDLKGITTSEGLAKRLTLLDSNGNLKNGPFQVIEFDTPSTGLSSPVLRSNPGFIGGGRTAGGAREFTIPNKKLLELKNVEIKLDIKL